MLHGRIGDPAVAAWQELGDDVPVKREIIRTVADIKLLRAGFKGEWRRLNLDQVGVSAAHSPA